MSALTGSETAAAMRATASNMTETGMSSSANPSDAATPALVVAIAAHPAFSKMQALAASHALASTRKSGLSLEQQRHAQDVIERHAGIEEDCSSAGTEAT